MNEPRIEQPHRSVMSRRGLLIASLGAAVALRFGGSVVLAQEPVASAEPQAVPTNAVAWPKYTLNTASTEQFMSIPGAGERMTREFEEYRPYTSIGQFRAEIGKYVSPEDVAAFERYLFVPVAPAEADPDTMQQLPGVNADVAQTLSAEGPFATIESFLAALDTTITPELAAFAKAYVVGA